MERIPMTLEGYQKLKEELKRLKTTERYAVAHEIEVARAHGDLRENGDYDAAKEKQGLLEATIRDWEDKLARADPIDVTKLSGDRIVFGATVKICDTETDEEQQLQIVGELEADVKSGRISVTSPIARGLIGKQVDDVVKIQTPGGTRQVEIIDVLFI